MTAFDYTTRGRTMFVLPVVAEQWPPALKDAVAARREATITGVCPACGAHRRGPNREQRRALKRRSSSIIHTRFVHEAGCVATDDALADAITEWRRTA